MASAIIQMYIHILISDNSTAIFLSLIYLSADVLKIIKYENIENQQV